MQEKNEFTTLDDALLLNIFSYFKEQEQRMVLSIVDQRFFAIARDQQCRVCRMIENDANYYPLGIMSRSLLNLVMDEQGNTRYAPRRVAIAIEPSEYTCDLGVLYQLKLAGKFYDEYLELPLWKVDSTVTMMVQANGSIVFYSTDKVKEADFTTALNHLGKEEFLGYVKLPTP